MTDLSEIAISAGRQTAVSTYAGEKLAMDRLDDKPVERLTLLLSGTGSTVNVWTIVDFFKRATQLTTTSLSAGIDTLYRDRQLGELRENIRKQNLTRDSRSELSTIRFNFSLNISRLADVLRVTRRAIYDWLDEENEVRMKSPHQERINRLGAYARSWWRRLGRQCPEEFWETPKGLRLFNYLKEDVLDDARIYSAIEELCQQIPPKRRLKKITAIGRAPRDELLSLDELRHF